MSDENEEPEEYEIWGLSSFEARELLTALEAAGIVAQTRFIEEPTSNDLEGYSPETEIIIVVEASAMEAVRKIERDLFSDER